MKTKTTAVEPSSLDAHSWQRRVIHCSINLQGQVRDFAGEVLVASPPSQGHVIEFEVETGLSRTAEVTIPLWVNVDASLTLFVNGQSVRVDAVKGSGTDTSEVYLLRSDLTAWTEVRKTARLRLLIVYRDGLGTATLPVEYDERFPLHPTLTQVWSWKSALQPLMFSAFAWGCIVGLAIIFFSQWRSLGDKLRYYAVLSMVGAWVGGVLGIPDLAKIPLWPLLRRLYSLTHPHRGTALLALSLFFLAISLPAGRVVYCLYSRQHYANLIERALRKEQGGGETIRRAFVWLPWRKEAQALFEVNAYTARHPGSALSATQPEFMKPYRKYVSDFVGNSDVKKAVAQVLASPKPSCCLDANDTVAFSDPVIWYASILPESESNDTGITEAIRYLSNYYGTNIGEARLLRLSLQLYRDQQQGEEAQASHDATELQVALNGATKGTFTYQFASDYLGSYYVRMCNYDDAYKAFASELDARVDQSQLQLRLRPNSPLWGRPLQKLILPYMFLLCDPEMKHTEETCPNVQKDDYFRRAKELLDAYALPCDHPFKQEFKEWLLEWYPSFQKWEAWLKGTLLDPAIKIDQYISQSLDEGWRY
jgi:hypothetical protein